MLMVGLPAAGKTTRARVLAAERPAVRLSPDEWMIPLFGESDAGGRRDVLEGRLVSAGLAAVACGADVVLDFGCLGRDERFAVHAMTLDVGARYELHYLPVDRATQLARVADRWSRAPASTFPMTDVDLDRWRRVFQEPDAAELAGAVPGPPPGPWADWWAWAAWRWPSLTRPDGAASGATRGSNT